MPPSDAREQWRNRATIVAKVGSFDTAEQAERVLALLDEVEVLERERDEAVRHLRIANSWIERGDGDEHLTRFKQDNEARRSFLASLGSSPGEERADKERET